MIIAMRIEWVRRSSAVIGLILCLVCVARAADEESGVFRFHIPNEPQSLDPARLTSTDASYFFNNIMRGLFSYSNEGGLKAEGAKSCEFDSPLMMTCWLAPVRWSDGSEIEAADYVRTFRRLLSAGGKNPSVDLLATVKNALAIHGGTAKPETLGVRASAKDRLVFEFVKHDPDFLLKLTASVLVPTKSDIYPKRGELDGLVFNGPYRVTKWTIGRRIRLESNPHYALGNAKRPPVEILFALDDDQTALNLYEQGTLTFLRRLPTTYIPRYKNRPDFHQIPMARFDYIGFGTELKDQAKIREALAHAADFKELKQIYDALGIPGCPGISETLMDKPRCIAFDLSRAKRVWAKVPIDVRAKRLKLYFSKLGGDDIKKGMEWFQAQWKKNLGIQVDLEQAEQGVFLSKLRENTPALFRKGVGLERPTCLAALETFAADGSENFLRIDDKAYQTLVAKLTDATRDERAKGKKANGATKKACGEGIQYLLDRYLLIPLGRIHFTILANPRFKAWDLNEMNQLDLANLSYTSP